MTTQILALIDSHKYSEAYELIKTQEQLPEIYSIWALVCDGHTYENIDRTINFDHFDAEMIEAIELYIHLSDSNWDNELLSEFRKIAKMLIAETAAALRQPTHNPFGARMINVPEIVINPEIRNHLQQLIEHFDKKELYQSKADIARVKAQLTLTMNLEKRFVGADMIQYGRFYEGANQIEDSIQIYYGVIHDFEEALHKTYEDKEEQLLELDFLKQAYEGIFRLTDDSGIQQKLNKLHTVVSALRSV